MGDRALTRCCTAPKGHTTMAETKTAAATATATNQFPGVEHFKKALEDQNVRVGQVFEEMGKAHTKWIEYGNTQIDEMAELMKTQFNYANELAAGWRKLSVESVKKSMAGLNNV
jgi:hypothetical protein